MADRPVLIVAGRSLFEPSDYLAAATRPRKRAPTARLARLVPDPSVNLTGRRCLSRMFSELGQDPVRVLVVGGGHQRETLRALVCAAASIEFVVIDVDIDADVDVFADAHDLPFPDGCFEAAVVTAVLEHVLEPQRVVDEVHRVLAPGGLIYSELPFIQQVHEGAYDFTRFTHVGHEHLLRRFDVIASGATAGPATALVWALEHFALALAGRHAVLRAAAKACVRLVLAWLPLLDRWLAQTPAGLDGASCTYVLGRRRDEPRSAAEIVAGYRGAQRLEHV